MKTEYIGITLTDNRRIVLCNPKTIEHMGAECWAGFEVNKRGEEIITLPDERVPRVIWKKLIKSVVPLKMNPRRGELESLVDEEPRKGIEIKPEHTDEQIRAILTHQILTTMIEKGEGGKH